MVYVVLGATGHVGSSVLCRLLQEGENVIAVSHSATHEEELRCTGAEVVTVDIADSVGLTRVLSRAGRAFLLNPPGNVAQDSDQQERRFAASIVKAVKESGVEYVVAASTQGAQPGQNIGDLGVLYEFEQGLRSTGVPTSITRGAYYYSNWEMQLDSIRQGRLISFFPADFKLPMVAPEDLGAFNGNKLLHPSGIDFEIHDCSGPRDYTIQNVADAFALALNRNISLEVIPRERWIETYRSMGFSEASAISYANMVQLTLDTDFGHQSVPYRGSMTLESYIAKLVKREIGTGYRPDFGFMDQSKSQGDFREMTTSP